MFSERKILITGASGFIGTNLLHSLLNSYSIACIDLQFNDNFIQLFGGKVTVYQGNLLDKNFVNSCIKDYNPNFVFHLAGSKSRSNELHEFRTSIDINYFGTLNLFESLINNSELKLIALLGTVEEYGLACSPFREDTFELPVSAYGLSKLSVSKLSLIFHHQFNLPVVVLRPSIAYGPGQGTDMFIPSLIHALLKKESFRMTEGMQLRDFLFIKDLVDAMVNTLTIDHLSGNIINIASGNSVKLKEVAWRIADIIGNDENLKIGAIPYRKAEIMHYEINISKAKSLLNWHPITKLEYGLIETINFYKENFVYEG